MDITSLKTFIAVAQAGSFSHAAEKLHVTQPAVSKRINNLELQLESHLFDRIGHSIELTQAGELLLERAEKLVKDMENCFQEIKNLNSEVSGTIKLGLSHYIGLLRIPAILRLFSEKYPQVELDIQFYDSESAQHDVQKGLIDIAVVTLPKTLGTATNDNLEEITIWKDDLIFVAHESHPLTTSSNSSIQALSNFPAILPGLDTYTGQLVYKQFERLGCQLNARHPTNNLENIKVMIATGFSPDCWGVLPAMMLDQTVLKEIEIQEIKMQRELGCIYPAMRTLSNASQAFIDLLKTQTS